MYGVHGMMTGTMSYLVYCIALEYLLSTRPPQKDIRYAIDHRPLLSLSFLFTLPSAPQTVRYAYHKEARS